MKKHLHVLLTAILLAVCVFLTGCSFTASFDYSLGDVGGDLQSLDFPPVFKSENGNALPPSSPSTPETPETDAESGKQESEDITLSELRPCYGVGSNKRLEGNILVMLLFVDDDGSRWSAPEISAFVSDQIKPAMEYLEGSAAIWDVELELTTKIVSSLNVSGLELKYEGVVKNMLDGNGSSNDVLTQAALDMGFDSTDDMVKEHTSLYEYDEVAYVTVLNTFGRSYSVVQYAHPHLEYAEHCVVFADPQHSDSSARPYATRSATVAHEFLHLFGAEDFYMPEVRQTIAEQLYPDDIMLRSPSLSVVSVGELTAYYVGWTHNAPDICYDSYWQSVWLD